MNIDLYLQNNFKKIGELSIIQPINHRKRKHGVYYTGEAPSTKGVYSLTHGTEIVKFGDTNASEGMKSRINNYLSNTEATNVFIRENVKTDKGYDVYFFEIIPEMVEVMGIKVEKSIVPRSLEKALIEKFVSFHGKKPKLNKTMK